MQHLNRDLKHETQEFADDVGAWVRSGWDRLSGKSRHAVTAGFLEYVASMAGQGPTNADTWGELLAWLEDLGGDGQLALTEQLMVFCADFGIDLAWLIKGELEAWPQADEDVREMVLHYCLACRLAVSTDPELQRFRRRRLWKSKLKPV